MTGQPPSEPFQEGLEAIEGHVELTHIPPPVNPLQAQTAFERRAKVEDYVAHIIAIIQTSGFFMLAFAALLGFVDLSNSAAATFLGTVMGYAVGKIDPVLLRYFHARGTQAQASTQASISGSTAATPQGAGGSNGTR